MMTTLAQRTLATLFLTLVATLAPAQTKTVSVLPVDGPLTDTVFNIRVQVRVGSVPTAGATVTFSVSTTTNASATLLQASAVTDASGFATIQAQSNDWAGQYTVTGTSGVDMGSLLVTNRPRRFFALQDPVYGVSSIQISTDSTTCAIKSYQRLQPSGAPGATEVLPLGRGAPIGYVVFKLTHCEKANVGVTPGLREFVTGFVSDAAAGKGGYLQQRGLIPLPAEEHAVQKKAAADLQAMAAPAS